MKINVEKLNELLITNESHMEMSSKEIAKLFGKAHRNVIFDIKKKYIYLYGDEYLSKNLPEEFSNKPGDWIRSHSDKIFSILINKPITEKVVMIKINGLRVSFDYRGMIEEIFVDADFGNSLFVNYDDKTGFIIVKRWRELEQGLAVPAWEKLEGKAYTDYARKLLDRIDQEREEKEKAQAKSWFHSRECLLQKIRSKDIISSKEIAELFGVRHDNVMTAIRAWAESKTNTRKSRAQYYSVMSENGRRCRELILSQPYADNFVSEYRPFAMYGKDIRGREIKQMLNAPEEELLLSNNEAE